MSVTHVVGVDPGLVHTGVVGLSFFPNRREVHVGHAAVAGPNAKQVEAFAITQLALPQHRFIEAYRPRSAFGTDQRMVTAVAEMRKATGGTVLDNTGVKKVVKQPLMELLGVWKFSTVTHHQDLRSAARIALLGMLRDEQMNRLLADVVRDHLAGRTWTIQ
jgi:hypothetical protein